MLPPARDTVLTADEWIWMVRRHTRMVADQSGIDNAPMWGMNLTADAPAWSAIREGAQ